MKLTFSVGVSMEKLCPGNLEREDFPVTRYHRETGKPFEEKEYKYFASLVNGQRFQIGVSYVSGNDTSKIEDYFKHLGFDCIGYNFFYGIVGMKLKEVNSTHNTVSLDFSDVEGLDVVITNIRNMFKAAGFADDIVNSVKLQVTAG